MDQSELINLLAEALPYVEEGAESPCHKESGKARGRKLVAAMRQAIEAHDATNTTARPFSVGDRVAIAEGCGSYVEGCRIGTVAGFVGDSSAEVLFDGETHHRWINFAFLSKEPTFDPSQPLSTDNYPTFAAGAVVLVPDGYFPDGAARPWVPCTVVEQRQRMIVATNPNGLQVTCPAYAVRAQ
ncbi:hypothetical protein [Thalassobaculum litoreum]|uniref:Uncharacterized protein n=1 Tax=Thalassobaculum litoreum DSM 18839 TaxID=1123362 RepID=A0A8G2BK30_9PROT|nr:hypothetical protein [Thalassobaculum litoreum]SDF83198.1 hypothetical protein SAMN05660686_02454 [Thalassobaculum litoreum DSM 18839]